MKIKKIVIVIILSVMIELIVFNFWNLISIIAGEEYISASPDQIIYNEDFDGQNVQWFVETGNAEKLYNVVVYANTNNNPILFYTRPDGTICKEYFIRLNESTYLIQVGKTVSGVIGITLDPDSNIMRVCVNSSKLSFSFSRVIAIILIYYSGVWLFSIQKMPDYGLLMEEEK